ncbi:MAG: hypothetical protein FIA92_17250 [Chloroflexi bacterium]|nr:hypothetical protein [Chloroflexota bacterium]
MRTVALVGADGAGKSSIARAVAHRLGSRARYLYMGVNLEQSTMMLPTTRLAMAIKRARGGRPRMPADWSGGAGAGSAGAGPGRWQLVREAYAGVRRVGWLAEEWYRALVASVYRRRGHLVIFDRHFLFDYYGAGRDDRPGQLLAARLHAALLRHFYPRPDLVICLDAPADVLHERKGEGEVESLERRRQEYLALSEVSPEFAVVDATQPLPAVVDQVTSLVRARTA